MPTKKELSPLARRCIRQSMTTAREQVAAIAAQQAQEVNEVLEELGIPAAQVESFVFDGGTPFPTAVMLRDPVAPGAAPEGKPPENVTPFPAPAP